ncbi:MAG TPA: 1-(5-phosphoribosyl)-5-[(5-phosphoribosylamino)methylideneamino]imidazole-4-carboxamide isomerase [Syntrophales bacterium]|nr:1-(5-phosphoribosyl)-5-[(5-phosphoribosylamino)methylideneamino]imidazole-4-carboxamide isomerase [Syntrophales bacterium]
MIIIPAIDLKDGRCVRLAQGDFQRVTVYGEDPAQVARMWKDGGASRLHMVDLDGSLAGKPRNGEAVEAVVKATGLPVQVGGGIRSMETIVSYIEAGVAWVILGSALLKDESLVREACRRYPGRIILGIDARGGRVSVEGWTEQSDIPAVELANRYRQEALHAIVYTDIHRDGMEQGVNVEATRALADETGLPVIASGGVSGMKDIQRLLASGGPGILGVIVGRALYTGALRLEDAIAETLKTNAAEARKED